MLMKRMPIRTGALWDPRPAEVLKGETLYKSLPDFRWLYIGLRQLEIEWNLLLF